MNDRAHSARPARPVVRARGSRLRRSSIAAVLLWCGALAGFAVYLLELRSVQDTYGGVGTAFLLVLWLTLFSVLYHTGPRLGPGAPRRRPVEAMGAASLPPPPAAAAAPPAPQRSPIGERVDLVVVPSAALRNSDAQGRMMSALGARAGGLAEHEIDMMDWGFAYGVAWAVARSQDPGAHEEVVSERALQATQAVYEAYRGSPGPAVRQRSAPQPHAHGG